MEDLITKYFTNSLNATELSELVDLLQDKNNQNIFKKYAKDNYDLTLALESVDVNKEYLKFIQKTKKKETVRKIKPQKRYKIAAVIIVLIGLSYLSLNLFRNPLDTTLDKNVITIKLENGDVRIISEAGNEKIVNHEGKVVGKQNGPQLDYNTNATNTSPVEKLIYNELFIPNSKKFQLKLSDGTLIHLNSGSSIKYPVKFLKNTNREVYLSGEAYFNIEEDKNCPFIVKTKEMNIRALGTEFNVNSYPNNATLNTVLVEGSVALYNDSKMFEKKDAVLLEPNQIAKWNTTGKNIEVRSTDVKEYIAWTKGNLYFKIRPFSEIIKVLERHYDVVITNNYKDLNEEHFFASFDTETIEQVLISFQNSQPFNYKIDGNHITITNP